jgi:hypothetical protein
LPHLKITIKNANFTGADAGRALIRNPISEEFTTPLHPPDELHYEWGTS